MIRSYARRLLRLPSPRKQTSRPVLEHLESRDVPSLFNTLSPVTVSGNANFGCVATGDFTDDGKDGLTDLVMTNYGSTSQSGNTLTILEPTGNGTFKVGSTVTVGSNQIVEYVAVGDLYGDGNEDLAVVASNFTTSAGDLIIFKGNGDGTFTKENTYATGLNNIDWVGIAPMFAGSTVPSIVVSAFGHTTAAGGGGSSSSGSSGGSTVKGNGIEIFQGNGNGTFSLATTYQQGVSFIPTACALGYFSGTSNLDIACTIPGVPPNSGANQPNGSVEVIVNDGEGGLTEGNSFDSGGPLPISIATTEFTSSGLPDLVVANAGDPTSADFPGNSIGVLINTGGDSFSESTITAGVGKDGSYGVFAVATGDFNEDGNQDIAAVEYGTAVGTGEAALLEYAGNGQGGFTQDANNPYQASTEDGQFLAVGNFGNGVPDIAICTADSSYDVFMNTTTGSEPTTTTVTSTPSSPIDAGTSITFTATVSGTPSGTPNVGTVTFYAGPGLTNPIGSPVNVSNGTAVSAADTTLPVGSDTITAVYNGGTGFQGSQGTENVTVNNGTTTTVTSTPSSPITQGTSIDFTATISGNPSVGTVTFYAGPGLTNPIGSPVNVSGGTATSAADTTLPVGSDTITAVYSGGTGFDGSQGIENVTVNNGTTTTVTSTPSSPITQGTSIDFTATISGSPSVGTVTFYAGPGLTNPIGSPVNVSGGTATSAADTTLPVGTDTITAVYSGGTGFGGSQGTENVTVNSGTTVTVTSTPSSPIASGTAIDFMATISGSPSVGTVTFYAGPGLTNPIGSPVNVSNGTATSAADTTLPVGSDTITAVYSGGTGFGGGQGTETVVVNANTTTSVSSTPSSPITQGTSIDFTATISGSPSVGTVTFYAGPGLTNPIGSPVNVSNGTATSSADTTLPVGTDTITAVYSGGTGFEGSQGTENVIVNNGTTTTVTSTPSSPITQGTSIDFTATISGSPSVGTVTFYAGPGLTNPIGSPVNVSGGTATSAADTTLPVGSDTITAVYNGGTDFAGSQGTETVVVNANTTTSVSSTPSSPITQGTSIDFTATISGNPSVGTVTFYAGPGLTNPIGSPVNVSNGTATSAADTTLPVGSDTITAVYSGGTGFAGSQGTETVTVNDQPPTVATPAAANPSTVTGTTTALSVLGADVYYPESTLTYTWATIGTPPASVNFSADNGTNAAQDITATFAAAGSYDFQVTITAPDGLTATSDVDVKVNQTLTSILVSPSTITVPFGGTQSFSATAKDQFSAPLSSQPTFIWSSNVGSVDASGNFTAQDFSGTGVVTAQSGSFSGSAAVTVSGQHPVFTSSNSTTFTTGTAGSFTATASGFPAPTFIEAGPLPSGVTFTSAGVLSGTPAVGTDGVYPIVFLAINGISPDAIQSFTLTVDQAPAITSSASTTFEVGASGSFSVTASGYPASTFTEVGPLPSGVTLSTAGVLSGTPAAGTQGVYPIVFLASNGISPDAMGSFTLTVDQAPAITSSSSTTFTAGASGSFSVTASGFPAPTFTEVGPLPSGVTLTSAGVLSGTPAAGTGGVYPIVIVATNGASPDATQAFSLTVDQAPAFTSAANTGFTIGASESFSVTASGYPAPTFTESGPLPSGVTLSTAGVLSGIPAPGTAGTYPIVIEATNGISPDTTQPFTLTIGQPPSLANSFVTVLPGSVQAGGMTTITLQAVDADGNDLTVGGLSVAFTLGNGIGQGNISAATDQGNGKYTATFTGTIAGSNTITATIGNRPVTSVAPSITVIPGPLSLLTSQLSTLLPSVQLGGETTVVLQGEDAYGNLETSGGVRDMTFGLKNGTGGQGTISTVTDNNNGTYTAIFVGNLDGSNTIGATVGNGTVTSTAAIGVTGAVVSLPYSIVTVATPGSVQSGSGITVYLQAASGKGVKETSGGLVVSFGLGYTVGAQGTFGPVTYLGNGRYSSTFTGTLVGRNTITATVNGSKVTSAQPLVKVTPGPLSYSNSLVTVSSAVVKVGVAIELTFQPRDAAGNKLILNGLNMVAFGLGANTTAQGTLGKLIANPNGTYTQTFKGSIVGGTTIVATVNNQPITSTPPVVTVIPGRAIAAESTLAVLGGTPLGGGTTEMVVGGTITLTLQAKDYYGNLENTGGLPVAFLLENPKGSRGKFGKVIDNKNGTYTVTFTATTAGTNTIEAMIAGVKLTSTVAIAVTP
jgi:hypothetical protein